MTRPGRRPGARAAAGVAREALFALVSGAAFALAANALSPRGLPLSAAAPPSRIAIPAGGPPADEARLAEPAPIGTDELARLLSGPSPTGPGLVLIDARSEARYAGGHLPGALHFDPYRPENHYPRVLPACLAAAQIVVYCNGGACEDSRLAAGLLRDAGVPAARLRVYHEGIAGWTARAQPLETGAARETGR